MESFGKSHYVCTLGPELIKKAEHELNEKPQWRERDIQALRDMVSKHQGLNARTDDEFLLRFLRARKFDYDRAYNLLLNFYKMKAENRELFVHLKPSTVRHVLDADVIAPLENRDREGRRIILIKPGKWHPDKFPIFDNYKTWFVILSKLIEDEETQVNGIIAIIDMKDFGWAQAKAMSPLYAKKLNSLIQECFPLRIKGIHYINEPSMFDFVFSIIRPFLKEKIVKRLYFHGQNVKALHEFISPDYLPQDYFGYLPLSSNEEWIQRLLKFDAEFEEESKYGFQELQVASKLLIKDEAMECLVGTYRSLDVE